MNLDSTIDPPLFSVITVCRNAEREVTASIESLASQTFGNWEWIMVDGASTDGTVASAYQLKGMGRRQEIISEPDSGIYEAMNKGLKVATGRFVHFLNAGDAYHDPTVLENVAKFLQDNPDTDFLYGNIFVQAEGRPGSVWCPPPPEMALQEMVCGCLPHQASFARLSLFFGKIGLFNETLRTASDYQWMMRVVSSPGTRIRYLDRNIAIYSADGASSKLELSLPESFMVLNQEVAFHEALGMKAIIAAYQQQVLSLRVQLRDTDKRLHATSEKAELRKSGRATIKRIVKSWIPKWLRF